MKLEVNSESKRGKKEDAGGTSVKKEKIVGRGTWPQQEGRGEGVYLSLGKRD